MSEIGEDLRLERERRGVSLDAMSAETKVNLRHFYALERGDFHELPGGVFRRGIVRAYLSSLGLEEEGWLGRFDQSVQENARTRGERLTPDDAAWATFAANVRKSRQRQRSRNGLRWAGVLGLLLVFLGATWAVWHFELQRSLTH